eukprot:1622490-Amphidinium_carterae.2
MAGKSLPEETSKSVTEALDCMFKCEKLGIIMFCLEKEHNKVKQRDAVRAPLKALSKFPNYENTLFPSCVNKKLQNIINMH